MTHHLKTVAPFFNALWDHEATFGIRDESDLHFQSGDFVYLQEFDAVAQTFSGRVVFARVGAIRRGPPIAEGYCVLSLISPARYFTMPPVERRDGESRKCPACERVKEITDNVLCLPNCTRRGATEDRKGIAKEITITGDTDLLPNCPACGDRCVSLSKSDDEDFFIATCECGSQRKISGDFTVTLDRVEMIPTIPTCLMGRPIPKRPRQKKKPAGRKAKP